MRPTSRRAPATTRPSSTGVPANRPPSGRQPAASRPPSGRLAAKAAPEPETPPAQAEPARAARPGSRRTAAAEDASGQRTRPAVKAGKAPYVIGGLVVLVIAAACAYAPVMRSIYLGRMDNGGDEGMKGARSYYDFVGGSEAMVRDAIASNRGPFEAQLWLAKECASIAALMVIAERRDLPVAQLATTLDAAVAVFHPERHKNAREPAVLDSWAKDHAERSVALPAIALKTAFARATGDAKAPELLAVIAGAPAQDSLRVTAALDGLALLSTSENLGLAIGLLRSNASDQVVAHPGMHQAIVSHIRVNYVESMLGLTSSQNGAVRALALEALGNVTLPDSADPKQRERIGEQVSAKLAPGTPAIEMTAALKAVQGLRLTGARDAVLSLLPDRASLNLAGIDDDFWVKLLGASLILTQPAAARPASEDLIAKLTAALDPPATRSVAARSLGLIRDPGFVSMRPALDKLAALGEDADCFAALSAIVSGAYKRTDVSKANGSDLTRWQDFLAKDRPRYTRIREIIEWHKSNGAEMRVTDGSAALKLKRDYLDSARDYLQPLFDDAAFVPPLGLEFAQVKEALRRTNELGTQARNFLAGANQH